MSRSAVRVVILTALSMLAFAGNSVLARLALASGDIDGLAYTGVRVASGGLALLALLALRRRAEAGSYPSLRHTPTARGPEARFAIGGSWPAAAALLGYMGFFTAAYLILSAGTGALILFASVQMGILAWAIFRGDRPGLLEWAGMAIALASLAFLVSPGVQAPAPLGAVLMVAAGISWAAYTLLGRGSSAPLADTAGNFLRWLPLALAAAVIGVILQRPGAAGLAYAVASGVITSGIGYAIWYAVLPDLRRTQAAFVQLTVPAIAALGGVLFIHEMLTARLVLSAIGIIGGVSLALAGASRRPR